MNVGRGYDPAAHETIRTLLRRRGKPWILTSTRFDFPNDAAEIGYVINPDYSGNGYATEAVKIIMKFGFEKLGFHRIEAKFIVGNDASLAVMKKCGMTYEGTAKGGMLIKGKYRDIGTCAIIENDYKRG